MDGLAKGLLRLLTALAPLLVEVVAAGDLGTNSGASAVIVEPELWAGSTVVVMLDICVEYGWTESMTRTKKSRSFEKLGKAWARV